MTGENRLVVFHGQAGGMQRFLKDSGGSGFLVVQKETQKTDLERAKILTRAGARRPLVIFFSEAMTTPSLANIPTLVPALLIASMAYST